jgi:outer membrane protein assembly factor BamB
LNQIIKIRRALPGHERRLDSRFGRAAKSYESFLQKINEDVLRRHTGPMYVYLQRIGSLEETAALPPIPVQRVRAGDGGRFNAILRPNAFYEAWMMEPNTTILGGLVFRTPGMGGRKEIPLVPIAWDQGEDVDNDRLTARGERVAGTNPQERDTDGDSLSDFREIRTFSATTTGGANLAFTGLAGSAQSGVGGVADVIYTANGIAVLGCGDRGLTVYNISSGAAPIRRFTVDTPGRVNGVALYGDRLAVADGRSGLTIIRIGDLTALSGPVIEQSVGLGANATCIHAIGNIAVVGLSDGHLVAVDIVSGTEISRVKVSSHGIHDVSGRGSILYAVVHDNRSFHRGNGTLHVVRSDAGKLEAVTSVSSPGRAHRYGYRRVFVGDGYLYTTRLWGINRYDLTDPLNPVLAKSHRTQASGWKQVVANGSGLLLGVLGQVSNFNENNLHVFRINRDGSFARNDNYVESSEGGTQWVREIYRGDGSRSDRGSAVAISLYNGLAYVADREQGLKVLNYIPIDVLDVPPEIELQTTPPGVTDPDRWEEGKPITLTATVWDIHTQVGRVEFLQDGEVVFTDGSYPFEYTLIAPLAQDLAVQTFTVQARAYDTGDNEALSRLVTITITDDATAPAVEWVSPENGGTLRPGDGVIVKFTERLDPATVTTESITFTTAGPDGVFDQPAYPFTTIGDLEGGAHDSGLLDITTDGLLAVGWGTDANGRVPVLWTRTGGLTAVPALQGGQGGASPDIAAHAITPDGSLVVGTILDGDGLQHAFRWTPGEPAVEVLEALPGGDGSTAALDTSADGSVIVGRSSSVAGIQAVVWTDDGVTALDTGSDQLSATALAVSAEGTVVAGNVTSEDPGGGDPTTQGFRWSSLDGIRLLDGIVTGLGGADGTTVLGRAEDPGKARYWQQDESLQLTATLTPEPAVQGLTLRTSFMDASGGMLHAGVRTIEDGEGQQTSEAVVWMPGSQPTEDTDEDVVNRSHEGEALQSLSDYLAGVQHPYFSNGLVAYYPFNGNANDESGNGNNGAVNGATLTADRHGLANSAYSFDGDKDKIVLSHNMLPSDGSEWSLSMWHKRIEDDERIGTLFSQYANGIGRFQIKSNPAAIVTFSSNMVDTGPAVISVSNLNQWNSSTFTARSNQLKVFINGILEKDSIGIANVMSITSVIGSDGTTSNYTPKGDRYFKGQIDDVRIYDRALSDSEVAQLYSLESKPPYSISEQVASLSSVSSSPSSKVYAGQALMDSGGREGFVVSLLDDDAPAGELYFSEEAATAYIRTPQTLQRGPFRLEVRPPLADPAGNTLATASTYSFIGPSGFRGRFWHDIDGDTVQDPGEPPLANRAIYIDKNGNGKPDEGEFARTDTDGFYSVDDLLPGDYNVQAVLDDNWLEPDPYADVDLTTGLVAYYPFNGNTNDESGNQRHGIAHGGALATDRHGATERAYYFDGNDHVLIPESRFLDGYGKVTISGWYSFDPGSWGHIIGSGDWRAGHDPIHLRFDTNGTTGFSMGVGASGNFKSELDTWYQLIVVLENYPAGGAKITAYQNGKLVLFNEVDTPGLISYDRDMPTAIGALQPGTYGQYWKGELDDVRIYDRALSEKEVAALYEEEQPKVDLTKGLVAHYPFNGNANDESGNGNNGTVNGATLGVDRHGAAGKAYDFDGDSNIVVDGTIGINHRLNSISCWIYLDNLSTPQYPFDLGDSDAHNNNWLEIRTSGQVRSGFPVLDTGNVASGQWVMLTRTHNGSRFSIYVDGVLAGSNDSDGDIPRKITIGSGSNGTDKFFGRIDEVRVYDRALSAAEVTALYNLEKPTDRPVTPIDLDAGLVAHYPFNGNAKDASGNGNDGTVDGVTLNNINGSNNSSYYFDGNNDRISLPSFGTMNSLSISVRVNPYSDDPDNGQAVMGSVGFWESGDIHWSIAPVGTVVAVASSYFTLPKSWDELGVSGLNNWMHLLYTAEKGSSAKIFVNGVMIDEGDINIGIDMSHIAIGYNHNGLRYFHGLIDDVRIYDRALTEAEIGRLYVEGMPDTDGDGLPDAYEQGTGRFFPVTESMTWEDASKDARLRGGHLATITSQAEWDVAKPLLDATSQERLWLGGTDEETEGEWKWITGESWGFSAWDGQGQPDNANGNENHLEYHNVYIWNDVKGTNSFPYLLEIGYPTDPTKADTDGDGFDDRVESLAGSDPNNPDVVPLDLAPPELPDVRFSRPLTVSLSSGEVRDGIHFASQPPKALYDITVAPVEILPENEGNVSPAPVTVAIPADSVAHGEVLPEDAESAATVPFTVQVPEDTVAHGEVLPEDAESAAAVPSSVNGITLSNTTVLENHPFGTLVGSLSMDDDGENQPDPVIITDGVGEKIWEFETGGSISRSSPAIGSDGTLYVGSGDNKLYAINGQSGVKLWEFATGGEVLSSPSIGSDGTVYVGSFDNKIYAINGQSGVKLWEFATGSRVISSPAIGSDGTVYVGSDDNKLYALNGKTGVKLWEFETGGGVEPFPAIGSDGTVYVGSGDTKLYAINGKTGVKIWEFETGSKVRSSPAIGSDGTVYIGSRDNKLYAINGKSGVKQWEFATGDLVVSSPAIGSDGTVYVGSWDKKLYAINGKSGDKLWEFETGGFVRSPPAIGSDGTVYVGSRDDKLYALDGKTGVKQWEFETGDDVDSSPAIGPDGTVYVGSNDGKLYALQGSSGPAMDAPWSMFGQNVQRTGRSGSGFQLVEGEGDTDNNLFHVLGNTVRTVGALDFENAVEMSIRVRYFEGDTSIEAIFPVTVRDMPTRPLVDGITLDNASILENQPAGTLVGRISLDAPAQAPPEPVLITHTVGQKKWEFETGASVSSSPAIGSDGTVYVGSESPDNKIYALDGQTGARKWEFETGDKVVSSPAIGADGMVYVGSDDQKLYALDGQTGEKKWEFETAARVESSPAIGSDGTVYVGSADHKLYAINGQTGIKKWEFETGHWVRPSPAIGSDGTIYVGSYDDKVYALDGQTGTKQWEFETGVNVFSSVAIGSDGIVYVGSANDWLYALDGQTGAKLWEFETGGDVLSSPAIGLDGTVYVGSRDHKLYALNGQTGAKLWEFETGHWVYSSPAIGSDGTVYVGSNDNKVYALNGQTGVKLWEFETGDDIMWSSPAIGSDGTVYVGSNDNKVYAIQGSSGPAMDAPWPMFGRNARRAGQAYGYQLVAGDGDTDNALFTVAGGELKLAAPLDFETKDNLSARVRYVGAEGALEVVFPITVRDMPTRPLVDSITLDNASILENQPAGTLVGRISLDAPVGASTASVLITEGVGEKIWEFATGASDPFNSSPSLGLDGTVYFGSSNHKVYALDGLTGAKIWEFVAQRHIDSSPAIGMDGTIYVGSREGTLFALDGQTGVSKWEFGTGVYVGSSPGIGADGTIYFGSADNRIYAVDGKTGTAKWQLDTAGDVSSSPAIGNDGTVYIGIHNGRVYALDGQTGAKKWEYGSIQMGSPVIGVDGIVYVSSDANKVYALDGQTGARKWEFGSEKMGLPAIGVDGTVYIGSDDNNVYALDGRTGAKTWEFVTGGNVSTSPAVAADGTVYIGSSDNNLYALDGSTGVKKWEFQTGGEVNCSPVIGMDGTIYVGSNDNKLYAIKGSSRPAESPWPMFGQNAQRTGRKMPYAYEVKAFTKNEKPADTSHSVGISFLIDDAWTIQETFFTRAGLGEISTNNFTLSSRPSAFKLVSNSQDQWEYWKIAVNGVTIFEDSDGHYINAYPGAIVERFYDISSLGISPHYKLVAVEDAADNALFTLSNGELKLAAPLDFETQANLSPRVRYLGVGGQLEVILPVTVRDMPSKNFYHVDGVTRPDLSLAREQAYHFRQDGTTTKGYPFYLATVAGGGAGYPAEYTTGVTNGRADSWLVSLAATRTTPESLYYESSRETGMGGRLAFPAPRRSLMVTVDPPDSGDVVVTRAGSRVLLPDYLRDDALVDLYARPRAGYRFAGWSGPVVSGERTIQLTMDAAKSVNVHFEELAPSDLSGADSWNLTLSLEDGHTVVLTRVEDDLGEKDAGSGQFAIAAGQFRDFDEDTSRDAVAGTWEWDRLSPDENTLFLQNLTATLSGDASTQAVLGGTALLTLKVAQSGEAALSGTYTVEYGDETTGNGTWSLGQ